MRNKLPSGVTVKHGRYYRIQSIERRKKWHALSRVDEGLPALFQALKVLEEGGWKRGPDLQANLIAWRAYALPGLSTAEQKEVTRMSEVILKAFQEFNVADVQAKHVLEFINTNWVVVGKLRTAQRYLTLLKKFFKWGIVQGLRTDNPAEPVSTKAPQARSRYITDAEYRSVYDELIPVMQCFVDLCYLTGQRTTDIRNLLWTSVDNSVIHFLPSKTQGSSGKRVDVPITPDIEAALSRAKGVMRERSRMSPYVIHTAQGTAYTAHGLGSAWDRACKRVGVVGATLKDLRAKHATDARKQGYSEGDIQVSLAHTDAGTTRVYLKERVVEKSRVVLRIPNAL